MLSSTWEVPEGTMTPKRDSSLCFACDDRRRYEPTRATKSGRAITSVDMDPTLPMTAAEISAGWLTGALHDSGTLQIFDLDEKATCVKIPDRFFWRMLLGESGWDQIEPTLKVHGLSVTQEISTLFSILFTQRMVVFWMPDHY